jgi:hypothetical protein
MGRESVWKVLAGRWLAWIADGPILSLGKQTMNEADRSQGLRIEQATLRLREGPGL